MLSEVIIQSPAKVNIGLRVFPRRADGFHSIESIFQTVQFYDDMRISLLSEPNTCVVSCKELALPAENTLTKAYRVFCRLTGVKSGVQITLTKRIPAGGGLGGGSSNAASFVKAFAALTNTAVTTALLDAVAAEVGSDVFFFMHCKENMDAAVVSGRGEIVKAIEPRIDVYFVLVLPEVHSSTKEAYELVDRTFEAGKTVVCPSFAELECMYYAPVCEWRFANTFTPALVTKYPAIAVALQDIRKSGAVWSDMTGSGAVVFGVYDSADSAKRAYNSLRNTWKRCVLA